jgi:hypothetical protein
MSQLYPSIKVSMRIEEDVQWDLCEIHPFDKSLVIYTQSWQVYIPITRSRVSPTMSRGVPTIGVYVPTHLYKFQFA